MFSLGNHLLLWSNPQINVGIAGTGATIDDLRAILVVVDTWVDDDGWFWLNLCRKTVEC